MAFMIRHSVPDHPFSPDTLFAAIHRSVPAEAIAAALTECDAVEQRTRKLPAVLTVWLTIGLHLFSAEAIEAVLEQLLHHVRLLWPDPSLPLPTKSAICQARYRLGAAPLGALFHQIAKPLATPETPGAFFAGLRLLALDGTTEDVPDTPANARVFGRPRGSRGDGAFPQVVGVYLLECGSHAIIEAGFWPYPTSERIGGRRLLRAVTAAMLLLWDSGFHSYELVWRTIQRGAQLLGKLPAHVKLHDPQPLADGSMVAELWPPTKLRRQGATPIRVRVITYTFTDPARPHAGKRHRLITTLLDPEAAPAMELVVLYHERWEVEIGIDEIDTHQRLVGRPLRSKKPVGVIQELYGLVIAHYAIRAMMFDAATAAEVDPDRLSFTRAIRLLQAAIGDFHLVVPEQHPVLYRRLLAELARQLLPPRRDRTNPRVVKRKMSKFRKKPPGPSPPAPRVLPIRQAIQIRN